MSVWTKLNTLLRASAQEPAEALVDANAIRIFEQELRDAEQAFGRSKRQLACLMAEKKFLERDNASLRESIENREAQAAQALEDGHEGLAMELATAIAEDENLLTRQQQHLERIQQQEARLRSQLRETARNLRHYQSELRLARTNQSAGRVNVQLNGYRQGITGHFEEMDQSLARIQSRQARAHDMDEALNELDQDLGNRSLDERLRAAGIDTGDQRAEKVLYRIRARQQGAADGK
ncbi:PspA/IM30 family protein [Marinobacter lacisalsi]|uniref:PspA/IM30 family protein n=1 Tax=Marinobacter lacisalsi TaxID=475979 RepID=A0ABV8QFM9_9GAMM